ncbi:hypothetical protein F5Y04DRAFT_290337 [Hypomontagnella monticulosa]|nr:hypothetical protein F5Y04DRAFT_290337 [Hypomontagnella monticulosa]
MACWGLLPAELKLQIFSHAVPRGGFIVRRFRKDSWQCYPVTTLVMVAREWQAFFEAYNFDKIVIRHSELPYFEKLYSGYRRRMLRWVWLRTALRPDKQNESPNRNDEIFTNAIGDLFNILGRWKFTRGDPNYGLPKNLTLLFSICSRSELASEDALKDSDEYHLDYSDPPSNLYTRPLVKPLISDRSNRVLKEPYEVQLDFGTDPDGNDLLPELDFVSGLWIPRKFYRAIPRMDIIIRSLPNLKVLRYEPWSHISEDVAPLHQHDTLQMMKALPKSLTTLSLFESFEATDDWDTRWTIRPEAEELLRIASQTLKKLDVSFVMTAEQFFRPFYADVYNDDLNLSWVNLECLALTAESLNELQHWQNIIDLLEATAQAALRMPKLRLLELWYCTQHHARVFRYTNLSDYAFIEWLDTGLPPEALEEEIMKSWGKVADKFAHGSLVVRRRDLVQSDVGSSTRLLRSLRCFNSELPEVPLRSMAMR